MYIIIYVMRDTTLRSGQLKNLASLLRLAAQTLRLFSDTKQVGGKYISQVTMISLRIEEDADGLEDFVKKEYEDQRKTS